MPDNVQSVSNSSVNISNIVTINGKDASEYVRELAIVQVSDLYASYNSMFWNLGQYPTAGTPFGAFSFPKPNNYPGAFTNVTFANGTTASYPNAAGVSPGGWSTDIADGESFTNYFCIEPAQTDSTPTATASTATSSTSSATAATSTTSSPCLLGHVYNAVAKDSKNQVAAYFLNGSDYEDTAVFYVASFANELFGNESTNPVAFQNTTQTLFNAARSSNKTKLAIDLSGNGGGNTILPNDLFRHLFPTIEPYGGVRVRVGDVADIYGQTIAATLDDVFSWYDLFPLNVQHLDNFTADTLAPLYDTYYDEVSDLIIPYGYANQSTDPQQFLAENIVIITEGICASACSIFTEFDFMTRDANVKTIAIGGRPIAEPMQAIGGTKGTLAQPFESLVQFSKILAHYIGIDSALTALTNATFPGLLPLGAPSALASYSINTRENIPLGDTLQTPLQYVFEPANCKMFFTTETAFDAAIL